MNKFLRVLGLGLMIATFAFAGFAQQERTREIVYGEFTSNYQSNEVAKLQVALNAAKEYVEKFNTADDEAQVTYFKNEAIPFLVKEIEKKGTQKLAKEESDAWFALLGNIEKANKAKNWAEVLSYGKQALDKQHKYLDQGYLTSELVKSQKLDIAIILGVMGFDRAAEKNDTFNNDAVTYLKQAIQQIEAGQTSKNFGLLGYELKNKENALGLMNYYIGYIQYYRQKKEGEAIPYFYKATQYNSAAKDFAAIYENIGDTYYDKIAELDKKRLERTAVFEKEENEETKAALAKEIKGIYAEQKGYAERGIEAYSKAMKAAQADAKSSQQYKDSLRGTLEQLYKFRFPDKKDGIDAYINTAASKPLTNPATPVQPITEEETPATTGSTTSTTTSTTPSTKPTTSVTKTTATKTTSPMANGTKTTVKTTTTTEAKTTPAKKPRKR
ncbi:hypothetical protein BH20ACI4_BH20ACI4_04660 [soil metagenome]